MDPNEAQLYLAETFGDRYRLERHVGGGHFSGVFQARDLETDREVAVKVLSVLNQSPEAILEFQTEAAMLDELKDCSNIVNCCGSGEHNLSLASPQGVELSFKANYMVLDYAVGTLEDIVVSRGRVPWADRLDLFRESVRGVHQMHLRRMVNRDIKSSNVLLFDRPPLARIADLGRSKDTRMATRFTAQAYEPGRGDFMFAPPELLWLRGVPTVESYVRADLYLLGSLLFELGTGLGITAFVFGDFSKVMAYTSSLASDAAREADFRGRLGDMRERYALAYATFALELPIAIRGQATDLLRLLTDPDPLRREPTARLRRNLPARWDLQWLLRRVDLLRRQLAVTNAPVLPWRRVGKR
jgi:eukaryotic-like serine/threonine-protein kinase